MRTLLVAAPGSITLVDRPDPVVAPHTVVVAVSFCGVCGSDLPIFFGQDQAEKVGYFGHEFSGTVVETGPGVEGLSAGDRVASGLIRACGRCERCLSGHPNFCQDMRHAISPGGFASRTLVRYAPDYAFLCRVPSQLPLAHAVLNEPLSCAIRIVEQGEVRPGDRVLVLGLGPMGHLSGLLARLWGAHHVVGVDRSTSRVSLAAENGLSAVDANNPDWPSLVEGMLNGPTADLVIEATGRPESFAYALSLARLGGRVVVGSVYRELAESLDLRPIMRKELHIIGAKGPFPHAVAGKEALAMEILASGKLPLGNLVRVYPVARATDAFRAAAAGVVLKAVVDMEGADG